MPYVIKRRRDGMFLQHNKLPRVRFSKEPPKMTIPSLREARKLVWYNGLEVTHAPGSQVAAATLAPADEDIWF